MNASTHTTQSGRPDGLRATEPTTISPRLRPAALRGARILLVEDDQALCNALRLRLTAAGMRVTTESHGSGARWDLLTKDHDALVLDLGLPDQSGLDLLSEVAERRDLPPVIVLTGADEHDCERARSLGARYVLRKPCPLSVLIHALESAIGG